MDALLVWMPALCLAMPEGLLLPQCLMTLLNQPLSAHDQFNLSCCLQQYMLLCMPALLGCTKFAWCP